MPLEDPGRPDGDLLQATYTLTKSFGLTVIVSGPGDPDACLDEVCRVVPAVSESSSGGPGIGMMLGRQELPWTMVTGPAGSAMHIYGSPDADSSWFFKSVMQPLEGVSFPWRSEIVTMSAMARQDTAHVFNSATSGVPAWELPRLRLTPPPSAAPPVPEPVATFLLNSGWQQMDGPVYKGVFDLGNGRSQVLLVGSYDAENLGLMSPVCNSNGDQVPPVVALAAANAGYRTGVIVDMVMMEALMPKAEAAVDQHGLAGRLTALANAADLLEQQFAGGDEF